MKGDKGRGRENKLYAIPFNFFESVLYIDKIMILETNDNLVYFIYSLYQKRILESADRSLRSHIDRSADFDILF